MDRIIHQNQCTGCGTCIAICPKACIAFKEDAAGFYYPSIDENRCIHCGLCHKVCPEVKRIETQNTPTPHANIVWSKSEIIRNESASGGAFSQFAQRILEEGGIVYGAAFDSQFNLYYHCATSVEELEKIRSSKYCHSLIGDELSKIATLLQSGKTVLFGGTSCQIAGLYATLTHRKIHTDKLITCGLICHGVASNKLLKDFIHYLEIKHKRKIVSINLRSKHHDDKTASDSSSLATSIIFNNGEEILIPLIQNPYMLGYIKAMFYRTNCYACRYAKLPRVEDITLGDYFEADKDIVDDIRKGVSIVLINNEKGEHLFNSVKNLFQFCPVAINQVIARKRNLTHPSIQHKIHDKFIEKYIHHGFEYVERKYLRYKLLNTFIEQNIGHVRCILSKIKKRIFR